MKYKIFVSGVQKELKAERRAVKDFIASEVLLSEYFDVFLFEDVCAKSKPAESVFLREVQDSDIYIGIIGQQYGSVGQSKISSTEQEYREAKRLDKTILVYIKGDNGSNDKKRDAEIQRLMKEIGDAREGFVRKRFSDTDELMHLVHSSLIDFLKEEGIVGRGAFDERICKDAKFSDIDEEKVRWFLGTAKTSRKYPLKQDAPIKDVFVHLDLLKDEQILSRMGLNERQRKAVDFIKISKMITNKDLRQLTDAIYRTASRDLDDLVKKGLFRKVGKTGRGAYYVLAGQTGHKQDKQDINPTIATKRRKRDSKS